MMRSFAMLTGTKRRGGVRTSVRRGVMPQADAIAVPVARPPSFRNSRRRTALLLRRGGLARPDGPLLVGNRADALVRELLDAFSLVGLRRVDVALRVGRDAVDRVELAGLASAVAEARQLRHRLPIEDVNLLVGAVGEEEVFLLRVTGEGDVPGR